MGSPGGAGGGCEGERGARLEVEDSDAAVPRVLGTHGGGWGSSERARRVATGWPGSHIPADEQTPLPGALPE